MKPVVTAYAVNKKVIVLTVIPFLPVIAIVRFLGIIIVMLTYVVKKSTEESKIIAGRVTAASEKSLTVFISSFVFYLPAMLLTLIVSLIAIVIQWPLIRVAMILHNTVSHALIVAAKVFGRKVNFEVKRTDGNDHE